MKATPTKGPALRMVSTDEPRVLTEAETAFEHWVYMLGKDRNRCALGPGRRKTIDRALGLYPLQMLLMAIEGCAASAWHAGDNDRNTAFNDITLILRDEEHIERFAEWGHHLRERVAADARAAAVPLIAEEAMDEDRAQASRARLCEMAARMRSGRRC